MKFSNPIFSLSIIILILAVSTALSATIHVPADQPTIQAGIDAAVAGDTVLVADGTYTGSGNRDIDFGGKGVVLKSENGPDFTIIDCEGSASEHHHGFDFHSGEESTAVVEGFTVQGGYVSSFGGAILCANGSNPTIANNMIINNQALNGGGGIGCRSSDPVLIGNFLTGNSADDGGAIMLSNSNATISYNVLVKNQVLAEGGALSLWNSSPVMVSNTIVSNTAVYGGGAIFICSSSPTLYKCLFAFNSGSGAITCAVGCPPSSPDLYCTNVFGNSSDWMGCIADQAGINGNFSLDPLFCDTANDNFHISVTSPCAPANSPCGELVGAFGAPCATEPVTFIFPETLFAAQAYVIVPQTLSITLGDFVDGHSAADINQPTIVVNGTVPVSNVTYLPTHENFFGDAVELEVSISGFLAGYQPIWGTVVEDYAVEGQFTDETPFIVTGQVTLIGHRAGDINLDGAVNISDITYLVDFIFRGAPPPQIMELADVDGSCGPPNIVDLTYFVDFLFRGGTNLTVCP